MYSCSVLLILLLLDFLRELSCAVSLVCLLASCVVAFGDVSRTGMLEILLSDLLLLLLAVHRLNTRENLLLEGGNALKQAAQKGGGL